MKRPVSTFWAGIAAATALSLGLRAVDLDRESLWLDELWTVRSATQAGWAELIRDVAADVHPPLYFALVRLCCAVLGTGEEAVRLPSVLAGVATVPLVGLLGRVLWGPAAGVAGAALLAAMPFAVTMSREARGNTLLAALSVAAILAASSSLGASRRTRLPRLSLLAVLAAALLYTHVWGAFVVLALGIWMTLEAFDGVRAWSDAKDGAGALVAGCFAFFPWVATLGAQIQTFSAHPWYAPPPPDTLGYLVGGLLGNASGLAALIGIALAALLARSGEDRRGLLLLASAFTALIAVPQLISALIAPIALPRNALPMLPLLCAAAGAGLVGAGRTAGSALAAVGVALLAVHAGQETFGRPRTDQWREASAVVRAEAQPSDLVLAPHPNLWRYYLPDSNLVWTPLIPEDTDAAGVLDWVSRTQPGSIRVWVLDANHSGAWAATWDAFAATSQVLARHELAGARVLLLDLSVRPVDLATFTLPVTSMGDDGLLHFWWNATVVSAPIQITGRCAVGVHGWAEGGPVGVDAQLALQVLLPNGDARTSVVHLGVTAGIAEGEPTALEGAVRISIAFTNDATGKDAAGAYDLNAHVDGVYVRCE